MKQLSTLLQNAIEDYFRQFPNPTLEHLKEVCDFNLSDVAFTAMHDIEAFQEEDEVEPILQTFTKAGNTLLGFPIGERINALNNLSAVAKKYGYRLFYGLTKEPYLFNEVQHTYEDNDKIVAVGFEKIKK